MSAGIELLKKIIEENRVSDLGKVSPSLFTKDELPTLEKVREFLLSYGTLPKAEHIKSICAVSVDKKLPYSFYMDELVKRNIRVSFEADSIEINNLFAEGEELKAFSKMKEIVSRYDVDYIGAKDVLTMQDMIHATLEHIRKYRQYEGLVGIPSGWPTLDHQTGGFRGGNLYVYAARPKQGKSMAIAYNSMYAYRTNYVPMVISMEMTDLEMALRMIAMEAGIDMRCMQTGAVSTFAEKKIRAIENVFIGKQPFYFVNGQFKKDVAQIAAMVYGMRPHILFIDGGYLIKQSKANDKSSRWEKMTEIAESLKTLAMTADIPIVVSFQFNRQVNKNRPDSAGFETIQLSDAIGQIASVGIGIFADEHRPDIRRLETMGGRQGEDCSFTINWLWDRMDFTETDPIQTASAEEEE